MKVRYPTFHHHFAYAFYAVYSPTPLVSFFLLFSLGIVPRCIVELFEKLQQRADENPEYKYNVYVSFLELYNEELIDLLNPANAQKRRSNSGTNPAPAEVSIREDIAGNIYWSGVREEQCESPEELLG